MDYGPPETTQIDPLSINNLWFQPSIPASVADFTWPVAGVDAIERFAPVIGDPLIDPRFPVFQSAVSYLWSGFIERIAPGISLDVSQTRNFIQKLLAVEGANNPPLVSAVVFFSQSVQSNWEAENDPTPANATDMAITASEMEQEVISHIDRFVRDGINYATLEKPQLLDLLSTLVVQCSAYVARGDTVALSVYLESGLNAVGHGFSLGLGTDETFAFLVRWLGYLHTVALLGEVPYTINAPDYLSIAAEQRSNSSDSRVFFRDVDSFLGISQTVGDLLYRLGQLIRSKIHASNTRQSSQHTEHPSTQFSELLIERKCFQTRMQLLLQRLDIFKQNADFTSDLDHYNESLARTLLLLFLVRVEGENMKSPMVRSAVTDVLESSAAVQETAPVAKLMLLPLCVAGIYTRSRVHQAFITRRLEVLKCGYSIVNVKQVLNVLRERWSAPESGDEPNTQLSVCCLF